MPTDSEIQLALDVLSTASPESLLRFRKPVSQVINQIRVKLSVARSPESSLLQALLKKRKKIHDFLGKPASGAVGTPSWTSNDPRLVDIEKLSKNPTDEERLRALLAKRSLALDAEVWEIHEHGTSRINDLVRQPHLVEDHHGYIQQFLGTRGFHGKAATLALEAIRHGQKVVVNERRYRDLRGSTALYSFCQRDFLRLPYSSLETLNTLLKTDEYDSLRCLATEKADYMEIAYGVYTHQCKMLKHQLTLLQSTPPLQQREYAQHPPDDFVSNSQTAILPQMQGILDHPQQTSDFVPNSQTAILPQMQGILDYPQQTSDLVPNSQTAMLPQMQGILDYPQQTYPQPSSDFVPNGRVTGFPDHRQTTPPVPGDFGFENGPTTDLPQQQGFPVCLQQQLHATPLLTGIPNQQMYSTPPLADHAGDGGTRHCSQFSRFQGSPSRQFVHRTAVCSS
jgi:hypothetical protein